MVIRNTEIGENKVMDEPKSTIGFFGIGIGGAALLLALIHFWAGPFAPQPTLEQTVVEKATAVKEAAVAAFKGEQREIPQKSASYDIDRIISIVVAALGGLAIILAVIAFAAKEAARAASGAAVLGCGAIAFQLGTLALGVFFVLVLIAAVLSGAVVSQA